MKAVSLAAFFALALALACLVAGQAEAPRDRVERCWSELTAAGPDEIPDCFLGFVRSLSPGVLGAGFESASRLEQIRFERAFASALRRELPAGVRVVRRTEPSESGGTALVYGVKGGEPGLSLGEATVRLAADGGPRDVLWNGSSLVRRYREQCERTLARYSFAYLVGELEGKGTVVLEDFEDGPLGEPAVGWQRRSFSQSRPGVTTPYRVLQENGNRFLRAEDRGENVMLYKEVRWDSRKYPYLSFRWRIRAVPQGSDERFEDKADSAAGLYLSYGRKLGIVPEAVKFVWSGTLAAGTAFRRPGIGMPWTVVAGSGPADADKSTWHRFVYDIGRVYRETFETSPEDRPLGIGLLTDANSTGGFASADYDDIVALAHSPTVDVDRIRRIEGLSSN